jgi:HEPN domain-containing protein
MGVPEAARLLLAKAKQDEYVLERFVADAGAADETFGFHAQQAAEKLLKAVLVLAGFAYPRTHRLSELLDLAGDHGLKVPEEFEAVHELTPFAVEYRYEFYAEETDKPLDRKAILARIRQLRVWVELQLDASAGGTHA